jgi:hypothetical protein
MHKEKILRLIERCKAAQSAGVPPNEIRDRVLPEELQRVMKEIEFQSFLDWVKEDREYSYYYYDAQQSGVCAKPAEAAAMILESIALDALE